MARSWKGLGICLVCILNTFRLDRALLVSASDGRHNSLSVETLCSNNVDNSSVVFSTAKSFYGKFVTYQQARCAYGVHPLDTQYGTSFKVLFPERPGHDSDECVFHGPYENGTVAKYNVSVSFLWSDGGTTELSTECFLPISSSNATQGPEAARQEGGSPRTTPDMDTTSPRVGSPQVQTTSLPNTTHPSAPETQVDPLLKSNSNNINTTSVRKDKPVSSSDPLLQTNSSHISSTSTAKSNNELDPLLKTNSSHISSTSTAKSNNELDPLLKTNSSHNSSTSTMKSNNELDPLLKTNSSHNSSTSTMKSNNEVDPPLKTGSDQMNTSGQQYPVTTDKTNVNPILENKGTNPQKLNNSQNVNASNTPDENEPQYHTVSTFKGNATRPSNKTYTEINSPKSEPVNETSPINPNEQTIQSETPLNLYENQSKMLSQPTLPITPRPMNETNSTSSQPMNTTDTESQLEKPSQPIMTTSPRPLNEITSTITSSQEIKMTDTSLLTDHNRNETLGNHPPHSPYPASTTVPLDVPGTTGAGSQNTESSTGTPLSSDSVKTVSSETTMDTDGVYVTNPTMGPNDITPLTTDGVLNKNDVDFTQPYSYNRPQTATDIPMDVDGMNVTQHTVELYNSTISITTDSPASITTDSPASITTDSPASITTDSPASITTDGPASITTDSPASITTDSPASITTDSPTDVDEMNVTNYAADLNSTTLITTENPANIDDSDITQSNSNLSDNTPSNTSHSPVHHEYVMNVTESNLNPNDDASSNTTDDPLAVDRMNISEPVLSFNDSALSNTADIQNVELTNSTDVPMNVENTNVTHPNNLVGVASATEEPATNINFTSDPLRNIKSNETANGSLRYPTISQLVDGVNNEFLDNPEQREQVLPPGAPQNGITSGDVEVSPTDDQNLAMNKVQTIPANSSMMSGVDQSVRLKHNDICDQLNVGYIVKLSANCLYKGNKIAQVEIITDVRLSAVATCYKDFEYKFNSSDGVSFFLNISYNPGDAHKECVFKPDPSFSTFTALVGMSWGVGNSGPCFKDYRVTCTLGSKSFKESESSKLSHSLYSSKEIKSNNGPVAESRIAVKVVDILNRTLTPPLMLGRKIRLVAESAGEEQEVGLTPTSCSVYGVPGRERYPLLTAGCGDGLILPLDEGFVTEGLKTFSPFFSAFRLQNSVKLIFECDFTFCKDNCNGSSCAHDRKKRSLTSVPDAIVEPSLYIFEVDEGLELIFPVLFCLGLTVIFIQCIFIVFFINGTHILKRTRW